MWLLLTRALFCEAGGKCRLCGSMDKATEDHSSQTQNMLLSATHGLEQGDSVRNPGAAFVAYKASPPKFDLQLRCLEQRARKVARFAPTTGEQIAWPRERTSNDRRPSRSCPSGSRPDRARQEPRLLIFGPKKIRKKHSRGKIRRHTYSLNGECDRLKHYNR